MLEINHVTKLYDGVHGINDISLSIPAGCIMGIIGHNGAGKTTLIKLVTGLLQPDNNSCTNNTEPNGASSLVQLLAKKI